MFRAPGQAARKPHAHVFLPVFDTAISVPEEQTHDDGSVRRINCRTYARGPFAAGHGMLHWRNVQPLEALHSRNVATCCSLAHYHLGLDTVL